MLRSAALAFALVAACSSPPDPARPAAGQPIHQVVALQHAAASDVVEAMMKLGLPYQVTISESAETNSLLVSGDRESVAQVLKVIARVDQPAR